MNTDLFRMKFYAERALHLGGIALHAGIESRKGTPIILQPAEAKQLEGDESQLAQPPFLVITYEEAQMLMDELWTCGIRPTEGSGSAGSLAATERHLADMRTIAMGSLKKQGAIET